MNKSLFKGKELDWWLERYSYNPVTGIITSKAKGKWKNRELTTKDDKGYIQISRCIDGKKVKIKGHRLSWFLSHGEIDHSLPIDHINGVRDDNRLCNLRQVSNRVNSANQKRYSTNKLGEANISWHKPSSLYYVRFMGKNYGYRDSLEEAVELRDKVKDQLVTAGELSPRHGVELVC